MLNCIVMAEGTPPPPPLNVLLVARDQRWSNAVAGATSDLGSDGMASCDARSALARLSGGQDRYSHLLVQPESADGLIDALADVTSDAAGSDTEMLILGQAPGAPPGIGIIRSANRASIRAALSAPSPDPADEDDGMRPAELREALAKPMIETRYQPIVSLTDRGLFAMEALARLNHPVLGTLSPDRFVPQMEAAGLAGELTDVVIRQAFADLTGPHLRGAVPRVTINFPLDVLLDHAALQRLEDQRIAAGIAADQVIVELTESRPADDLPVLRASLEWLRTRDYKIAIDDVGPAVPHLTPLLELPFTAIKLDMSLVRQVEENAEVRDFLARSTERAHQNGKAVVAEGVETVELWHAMKAIGVDAAQGFLVARPIPVAAIQIWLAAWQATPPIL